MNSSAAKSVKHMDRIQRQEEQRFAAYAREYNVHDSQIALKIKHTWKVVEAADRIAEDLKLSDELKMLAHLAALYHDIGRFEQVRRWHTFNDAASINHAQLSWQILREDLREDHREDQRFLNDLDERQKQIVLEAVRMHNQYRLDDGLNQDLDVIARIVRDADKIDIFRVRAQESWQDTIGHTIEEAQNSPLSEGVFQALMEGKSIERDWRSSPLDFALSFIGFFADMNYPISFQIAKEQGFWNQPLQQLQISEPQTAQKVKQILDQTEKLIDRKVNQAEVRQLLYDKGSICS